MSTPRATSTDTGRARRRIDELFSRPATMLVRDVAPVTPTGRDVKTVVGDRVEVEALLVRDGHDELAASLRWRRTDSGADRAQRR